MYIFFKALATKKTHNAKLHRKGSIKTGPCRAIKYYNREEREHCLCELTRLFNWRKVNFGHNCNVIPLLQLQPQLRLRQPISEATVKLIAEDGTDESKMYSAQMEGAKCTIRKNLASHSPPPP